MDALSRAFHPNLTSLTITSLENTTADLEGSRGGRIRGLSLFHSSIDSIIWFQALCRVPNVRTPELGLTPTVPELDPLTELMDAPAVNHEDAILVPTLSELRPVGDPLGNRAGGRLLEGSQHRERGGGDLGGR